MRLKITKSKNAASLYVIKDVIRNGKRTTKIVEKLGTLEELKKKLKNEDPIEWSKKYIKNLNDQEKIHTRKIIIEKSQNKLIEREKQTLYNCGYLFLEKIYYELKLNNICEEISQKYQFKFDLNSILSNLIYTRIIEPSSKLSSFEASKKFIEQPNYELHDIYRALEVISKETELI